MRLVAGGAFRLRRMSVRMRRTGRLVGVARRADFLRLSSQRVIDSAPVRVMAFGTLS